MNRRNFLENTGYAIGAGTVLSSLSFGCSMTNPVELGEWEAVRAQFELDTSKIQMAQMLLASHPKKVREAINTYRKELDHSPAEYFETNLRPREQAVAEAAQKYLNSQPGEVAMTDSTTMGLGILYSGLKLQAGDDILTTTHDHYSTEKSLEFAATRSGATLRRISLYHEAAQASVDEILSNLQKSILPDTRVVAVTFVHSCTGVKLPIREMSKVINEINNGREEANRIYFCVDAVHGFGIENFTVEELGCDFFAAGTHKWIFGPRGTGVLWAKKDNWHMVDPIIPPFSMAYAMWLGMMPEGELDFHSKVTPGGFHSYEHRWALKEAFEFHMEIGKQKIQDRTHYLSTILKEGLKEMPHIKLHTPLSSELSAGINCFEIKGMEADHVIEKLHEANIIGSTTPYRTVYARLTPCVFNTEEEVKQCISVLEDLKA